MTTLEDFIASVEAAEADMFSNSSDNGDNLQEFMHNVRYQPYETMAFFDACGQKICERTSHNQKFVILALPEPWQRFTHLMVHNHIFDRTFSIEDLEVSRTCDLSVNVVVSPHYNFYLFRPRKGWPEADDWLEEYHTLIIKFQQSRRHSYDTPTALHLALSELAQHYGITYRVTDLDGQCVPEDQLQFA